jgi:hypothetical protein
LDAGVLDEALERVVPGLLDDVGVLLNLAGFSERTAPVRPFARPTLRTVSPQHSPT